METNHLGATVPVDAAGVPGAGRPGLGGALLANSNLTNETLFVFIRGSSSPHDVMAFSERTTIPLIDLGDSMTTAPLGFLRLV